MILNYFIQLKIDLKYFNFNFYKMSPERDCGNCICHGFPCLNCAEFIYHGERGPGYFNRELFVDMNGSNLYLQNVLHWLDINPDIEVRVVRFNDDENINRGEIIYSTRNEGVSPIIITDPYIRDTLFDDFDDNDSVS